MTVELCRAVFALEEGRNQALNDCLEHPCGCEKFNVSEHSPGIVADDEIIHYLVPAPNGRTPRGTLVVTQVLQLCREGLSVLRDDAQDDEFIQTINELRPRWEQKERKLEGVLSFSAKDVRVDTDGRICGIYDSGLPGKPHHADVMAVSVQPKDEATFSKSRRDREERKILKEITDLMGTNFTPASEFRGGVFKSIVVPVVTAPVVT